MKRKSVCIFLLLALCFVLTACGKKKEEKKLPETPAELNREDAAIGVVSGYIFGDAVKRELPKADVKYYETRDDAYKALLAGQIDALADDEPIIRARLRSASEVIMLEPILEPSDYAFVFPKTEEGEKMKEAFSAFVREQKENGGLAELDAKWFGSQTYNKTSKDVSLLSGEKGTLTLAFDGSNVPFAYMSNARPVGYDIDLALEFCRQAGYGLEIIRTDFSEMLSGVAAGKYSAGCGAITITEERKETLLFSEADYSGGISLCVRQNPETSGEKASEIRWMRSFKRAFVEDGRYKRFFRGIGVTLLLTLIASMLGTGFGFLLYFLSRRGALILRLLARFLVWMLYGSPAIMLMMSLYYVYYRDLYLGGFIAASIGFTLAFGCAVYRILQRYAAVCTGGITEREYRRLAVRNRAFFRELFRQKGADILYDFRERVILLLKVSALAGFITVEDMTGVFDRIRKESLETMLPLYVTALAYFILIHILSGLLGNLIRRFSDKEKE